MTDSITPLVMLAIFLAGTLWLGLGHKGSHNITEFTIGNKMFTTAALIATIVATTWGGGGLIRTVEMIYDKGLWYIMLAIGGATVYTLLCTVVASRIGAFMEDHISSNNHLSMADTMGRIYGKTPRIITACANVAATAVSVAAQITVTSKALQICVSSVNPTMLIVISASIVILYSTLWLALLLGCSYPVGYFTENFLGSLDVNIRGKQLE